MMYYVIKKRGEKDALPRLIAGKIKWRVRKYLHNGKRTRNPPNISSIEVGDRFVIYFSYNKERLFYASGFLASKSSSGDSYKLSFHNQSGKSGFDEFLRKPTFAELKKEISWRPVQGDIQQIDKAQYKIIISNAGIEIPPDGSESENKSNSKSEKTIQERIPSTQEIAESSTWAMKLAEEYEEKRHRKPIDVSDRTTGYDIESRGENSDKIVRCIEVKGKKSIIQVALTNNEYETARRLGNKYYVYVVTTKGIHMVKNPVKSCKIDPIQVVAWELKDWQERATKVDFASKST